MILIIVSKIELGKQIKRVIIEKNNSKNRLALFHHISVVLV